MQDALVLVKAVPCIRNALEDACKNSGHLSGGEAATIANAVMEHGNLEVVRELRCAMVAVRNLRTRTLSELQLAKLAELVEEHARSQGIAEVRISKASGAPIWCMLA